MIPRTIIGNVMKIDKNYKRDVPQIIIFMSFYFVVVDS